MDIYWPNFYVRILTVPSSLLCFHLAYKFENVSPLHKKTRKHLNESCKPVSILPTLSKFFERIMFAQCLEFSVTFFRRNNVASGKAVLSAQQCLLSFIGVDKVRAFGASLTNFSKAFDCLCLNV